jgi:hypothetical protein
MYLQRNLQNETDCDILWTFDSTDYNGGVGTTVYDKSGSSNDGTVFIDLPTPWSSSLIDYGARAVYYNFSSPYSNTSYSVSVILKVDDFSAIPSVSVAPFTSSFYSWIFLFTDNTSGTLAFTNAEGLRFNNKMELVYENTSTGYSVILGKTIKDGMYQVITFYVNETANLLWVSINGKVQPSILYTEGQVNSITKNKLTLFSNTHVDYYASTDEYFIKSYIGGFKLSSIPITDFSSYATSINNKVWGSTYILKNASSISISDNILKISSVNSGIDSVKNFIILDSNQTDTGYIKVWFDTLPDVPIAQPYIAMRSSTANYVWHIATPEGLYESILSETSLVNEGVTAEIYAENGLNKILIKTTDGKASNFALILVVGLTSFQGSAAAVATWLASNPRPTLVDYEIEGVYQRFTQQYATQMGAEIRVTMATYLLISFYPYGDNQIIKVYDQTSIEDYGKQILSITNYNMVSNPIEKQTILANQLANYKDPKVRISIDVPFDYSKELYEYNRVQVQLDKRYHNGSEVGNYLDWSDGTTYRYKDFYINGISHKQDGVSTTLKLIEAII